MTLQIQPIAPTVPTAPPMAGASTLDAQVSKAWASRQLSDGTKLNLGRTDAEQGFKVTPDGTFAVAVTQSGVQQCDDGSSRLATRFNLSAILPAAGGHTHPRGRTDPVSGLPGPKDGLMARATGKPAYVISARGAFAIEAHASGFEVRQIVGKPLSAAEQGEVERTVVSWNTHRGGSGARCTFIPNR